MAVIRQKILVNGIVQGVGFRPFIYRLAQEHRLGGFVRNNSQGVCIEVEGAEEQITVFLRQISEQAPPLASIYDLQIEDCSLEGTSVFHIEDSQRHDESVTFISPDIAVCDACLAELFLPTDRRFGYPFINCTNCGPRYTIVTAIPYDRCNTSMNSFKMCSSCEQEYHDPLDRRFHAQPNACPVCGPRLTLVDNKNKTLSDQNPIEKTVDLFRGGAIVAIRGLGGFHLAVDAHQDRAVRRLRGRKGRAEKPFALMAPDLATVQRYCTVAPDEAELLQHHTRPIVLLKKNGPSILAPNVAPGNRYLGFMLPYTPLHHLLLDQFGDALVMTSGNLSEEPIAIGNDEALAHLGQIADYFLLHNREIMQRCDDSIVRVVDGSWRLIRRSRGFVPTPIFMKQGAPSPVLACGGELKNTIALARGHQVFLSQHIGDLDNPAALQFFENTVAHFQRILEIEPEVVTFDLHPEYLSTKWAKRQSHLKPSPVQHHHAHLASVLAENGRTEPIIGIILDGTGYGSDGTIWGGEILVGNAHHFQRHAWLEPVPMPGGELAIRQPWRMAFSYLVHSFGDELSELPIPLVRTIPPKNQAILCQMIAQGINSPLTSSCGRLFDGVSAMLNICLEANYEAQAAIQLEMHLDESVEQYYDAAVLKNSQNTAISLTPLIRSIVQDLLQNCAVSTIAAKFHRTLGELFIHSVLSARTLHGLNTVGLSGGVFQNVYFFEYLLKRLREEKFEVLTHRAVPTNDGGLALGQIAVAIAQMEDAGLTKSMTTPHSKF